MFFLTCVFLSVFSSMFPLRVHYFSVFPRLPFRSFHSLFLNFRLFLEFFPTLFENPRRDHLFSLLVCSFVVFSYFPFFSENCRTFLLRCFSHLSSFCDSKKKCRQSFVRVSRELPFSFSLLFVFRPADYCMLLSSGPIFIFVQ